MTPNCKIAMPGLLRHSLQILRCIRDSETIVANGEPSPNFGTEWPVAYAIFCVLTHRSGKDKPIAKVKIAVPLGHSRKSRSPIPKAMKIDNPVAQPIQRSVRIAGSTALGMRWPRPTARRRPAHNVKGPMISSSPLACRSNFCVTILCQFRCSRFKHKVLAIHRSPANTLRDQAHSGRIVVDGNLATSCSQRKCGRS